MPIATKRVYEPASAKDGFRLLVMRLWPRGVKKGHVSAWEKELGPSPELLRGFLDEEVGWAEYKRRYHSEMKSRPELLLAWAERAGQEKITLLCSCKDERFCHRTLLKEILEKRLF